MKKDGARPAITIFTPTFNRAYCLGRGYEALCRQTNKDFIWLIIDDGSTDNTKTLVEEWQTRNNGFEIRYVQKENGGLYSGYTTAFRFIDTELCVCVDSDDYLTDNAVELILCRWNSDGSKDYAGIIGLDCYADGRIIGTYLPNQKEVNLIELQYGKYNIRDVDRKNVVRTELYRQVTPFDCIPGEKDLNPHFLHLEISRKYNFLVLNERLCVVEYQEGGMGHTVFKQYERSPKSFRYMRLMDMKYEHVPLLYQLKTNVHYVSSCIFSGEPCISASPKKILTVLMWPLGLLFNRYIKYRNRQKN